jgi:hypothetical protein
LNAQYAQILVLAFASTPSCSMLHIVQGCHLSLYRHRWKGWPLEFTSDFLALLPSLEPALWMKALYVAADIGDIMAYFFHQANVSVIQGSLRSVLNKAALLL